MPIAFIRRRGTIAVAAAALATAAVCGGQTASAATSAEPVSTPVTINTPDGLLMSYIVNARIPTPGQTHVVEMAVEAAGGVVVQSWPQIGVVVAHSKVSTFRADVVAEGGTGGRVGRGEPHRRRLRGHARGSRGVVGPRRLRLHEGRQRRTGTATSRPSRPRPARPTRARSSSGT